MAERRGSNISFVGRTFDRRQLFAAIPQLVAERLAFPTNYSQATRRLATFVDTHRYRDLRGLEVKAA